MNRQYIPAFTAVASACAALVAATLMRRRARSRWPGVSALAFVAVLAVVAALVTEPLPVAVRSAAASGDPAGASAGANPTLASRGVLAQRAPVRTGQPPAEIGASPTARAARTAPDFPVLDRSPEAERQADPTTLLVSFRGGTPEAERRRAVEDAGGEVSEVISRLDTLVVTTDAASRDDVQRRLRADERVKLAERNLVRYASDTPNDENLPYQSNVFATRLPAAWDLTHGSATVDIAVLDTGVDPTHPDLSGRIASGRNVLNPAAGPADDEGHGTFVAGVAAAQTDNVLGIAGAAWNARIMPVKVLGADGSGDDAGVASGIIWATDNGAEIINLSLGGPGSTTTLSSAISYAHNRNVIIVAASGNEATSTPSYPASYPYVISVGATDEHGDLVYFSNRGPSVDVVAPGWNILSTLPSSVIPEGYGVGSGTSFSAPLVAGIAAMVTAKLPTLNAAQVKARLEGTAIDRGPRGVDDYYGYGLVDAYAAVGGREAAAAPPPVRDVSEPDDTPDRARPIGDGTTGTISPEGDDDWFSVDIPESGTVRVTVTPPANDDGSLAQSFDPAVTAYDTQLEWRPWNNAQGPGGPETAVIAGATAGRYLFHVRNVASSRSTGPSTAMDPYTVTSSFEPGPVTEGFNNWVWVRDIAPAPFAQGVPSSIRPTVTFTRDVAPASAEGSVGLRDMTTRGTVTIASQYDAPTHSLTVTPAQGLVGGRTYELFVGPGVSDAAQPTFTMPTQVVSRFTVTATAKPLDLRSDFNKDGFEDTVVGAPGEDHGSKVDGGVVHVLYGSASGPKGVGSQMWSQDTSGIADAVEAGDRFGESVATGDLNNDGYDDLVIGAPYEDGTTKDAGLVHVILGSSSGLRATGNKVWTQNSASVPGTSEAGDRFGNALAIGAFDGVAGHDVVVGSPGEAVGSAVRAGAVTFLRGGPGGLVATGSLQWTQDSAGIDFLAEAGDAFGAALAAGDFQGDGNDDLAIGAPSDNVVQFDEGSVTLMRGSVVGLRPASMAFDVFTTDGPESGDLYGAAVAIADVGGYGPADGYADLIVGLPGESDLFVLRPGYVDVVYSDHSEPWIGTTRLNTASYDMAPVEADSFFGASLAARTSAAGGVLVVGAPYRSVSGLTDAGAAHVYASSTEVIAGGFFGPRDVRVTSQGTGGVPDVAEANDRYATDVSLLDVDGDGELDLVSGAALESVGSLNSAGAVFVHRGVSNATPVTTQFSQNTGGVGSGAEANDRLGVSVG